MSENAHSTLIDAGELQNTAVRGDRVVSVLIAVTAVLAALGTLLAHHRSIEALTAKNQAILSQARASDAYARYEAGQVRYQIAQALAIGIVHDTKGRMALTELATREEASSTSLLSRAQALESLSEQADVRSEQVLRSYETLQLATIFFNIAVVIVSVSALARTRGLLTVGVTLGALGLVLLIFGYFRR